jgi:hypothetical protein
MNGSFSNIGHAFPSQPMHVAQLPLTNATHSVTNTVVTVDNAKVNKMETEIKLIKEDISAILKLIETVSRPSEAPIVNVEPSISITPPKIDVIQSTYRYQLHFDIAKTMILISALALGVVWKLL